MTKNFLTVTPSGAYQATNNALPEIARQTLINIMQHNKSPEALLENITKISGIRSLDMAKSMLNQLQNLHLIQFHSKEISLSEEPLEKILPDILKELSSTGKALLADNLGLCIAASGFSADTTEELAALSSGIISFQEKHESFFSQKVKQKTTSWGIINPAGDSQIGFWPLPLGEIKLILTIVDVPRLNRIIFRDLIWLLCSRYSNEYKLKKE